MPVIASVELDYVRASGRSSRDSERRDTRFGARGNKSAFFGALNCRGNQLGEFKLEGGGGGEAESALRLLSDRADDAWIGMAEDCRSVGADVIEKSRAVRIDQRCAAATLDKNRSSADCLPRAHRRIHRTRNLNSGAIEKII